MPKKHGVLSDMILIEKQITHITVMNPGLWIFHYCPSMESPKTIFMGSLQVIDSLEVLVSAQQLGIH